MLFKGYRKNCWQMVDDRLLQHDKIARVSNERLKRQERKEGRICRQSVPIFTRLEDPHLDAETVRCKADRLSCLPGVQEGYRVKPCFALPSLHPESS